MPQLQGVHRVLGVYVLLSIVFDMQFCCVLDSEFSSLSACSAHTQIICNSVPPRELKQFLLTSPNERRSLFCYKHANVALRKTCDSDLVHPLFHGIPQPVTPILNVVIYTACSKNRFEFLICLKFTRHCLKSR